MSPPRGVKILIFKFLSLFGTIISANAIDFGGINGSSLCPCLSAGSNQLVNNSDFLPFANSWERNLTKDIEDINAYGVGCASHDKNRPECRKSDDYECAAFIPKPPLCNDDWCLRQWCYIDVDECSLYHTRSQIFRGRYVSYASCGNMDVVSESFEVDSLNNRTYKVGFNSNSGGFMGAYNADGDFAVNSKWTGPLISFMERSALEGNFRMKSTQPPKKLLSGAEAYFNNSANPFDHCIYATSLGYLDFCIAAFTMTDKRLRTQAKWFQIDTQTLQLVIFNDESPQRKLRDSVEHFWISFNTVFRPFEPLTWLLLGVFVIPVLAILTVFHELGYPGSAYPFKLTFDVQDASERDISMREEGEDLFKDEERHSSREVVMRQKINVSIWDHIWRSCYTMYLSALQGSHEQTIVSFGGKVHLIGVSYFILMIIACYTANLASVFTLDARKGSVDSFQDAISAGYTFCAERKMMELVLASHKEVSRKMFALDQDDMEPGFNCRVDCGARTQVFDMMMKKKDHPFHCDAAITTTEDVAVVKSRGLHCNKTLLGDVITTTDIGIPINADVNGLLPLLHRLKNKAYYKKEVTQAEPKSGCKRFEEFASESLSIEELTGVWVVTFSFALMGIIGRWLNDCYNDKRGYSMSFNENGELLTATAKTVNISRDGELPISESRRLVVSLGSEKGDQGGGVGKVLCEDTPLLKGLSKETTHENGVGNMSAFDGMDRSLDGDTFFDASENMHN